MPDYLKTSNDPRFDPTVGKHRHDWRGGWLMDCGRCFVGEYDTRTKYCEDVPEERAEKLRLEERRLEQHAQALDICRKALTEEQWRALGLPGEYRPRDRITI